MPDGSLQLWKMCIAAISVAGTGGFLALLFFLLSRRSWRKLFTFAPIRKGDWNVFAVVITFVTFILTAHIVLAILTASGFYQQIYGPDFPSETPPDASAEIKALGIIRYLWAALIALPIQIAIIHIASRTARRVTPLHLKQFSSNFVSGFLMWVMVTPVAFSVFALANIANGRLTGRPPDKHPLTLLGESAGPLEWGLFLAQTIFVAPLLEELVFRGILLQWLIQRKPEPPNQPNLIEPDHRSALVMILSILIVCSFHATDMINASFQGDWQRFGVLSIPAAFFLLLAGVYQVLPMMKKLRRHLRISSAHEVRAIVASSVLFAAFHASVWPSPVPLFVLALGLGYLSLRTRSLVGPVLVHGMFNAVSAIYLVIGGPV